MNDPLETLARTVDRGELQAEIDRLEAEIQERGRRLAKLQTLRQLLTDIAPSHSAGEPPAQNSHPDVRPSLPEAVLIVMRELPTNTLWTADKVLIELQRRGWEPGGKTPRNSIDATFSRLRRAGAVERTAPGTYKLPSDNSDGIGAAGNSAASLLDADERGA
jgi:hypothetical protein